MKWYSITFGLNVRFWACKKSVKICIEEGAYKGYSFFYPLKLFDGDTIRYNELWQFKLTKSEKTETGYKVVDEVLLAPNDLIEAINAFPLTHVPPILEPVEIEPLKELLDE